MIHAADIRNRPDDLLEPMWHSGTLAGWRRLRAFTTADTDARQHVLVGPSQRAVDRAQARLTEAETAPLHANWTATLREYTHRLWALQAELWARLAHNMRVDARAAFLSDPLAAREALGGLAACERWFRRGLVLARRRELWKTVLREIRLVEWRDRTQAGTEAGTETETKAETEADTQIEPAEHKAKTDDHPTYADGTRRPALTRAQALERAEAGWCDHAVGGRPGKRAARGPFDHIPPALRFASVGAMPRPRHEPDIVFEYVEPYDPYPKPRTWTDPHVIVPPRGRVGALPAVVVDPMELGWTPDMTGETASCGPRPDLLAHANPPHAHACVGRDPRLRHTPLLTGPRPPPG